jgi:hypothetical protein
MSLDKYGNYTKSQLISLMLKILMKLIEWVFFVIKEVVVFFCEQINLSSERREHF